MWAFAGVINMWRRQRDHKTMDAMLGWAERNDHGDHKHHIVSSGALADRIACPMAGGL